MLPLLLDAVGEGADEKAEEELEDGADAAQAPEEHSPENGVRRGDMVTSLPSLLKAKLLGIDG